MPITLQPIPAQHPYVRAIRPENGWEDFVVLGDPVVDPADPARWWPHPALEPEWWEEHDADVVHLHFGFEHLGVAGTEAFLAALRRRGIPLVYTVHDLDNPHLEDQTDYHRQVALLVDQAAHVFTLSTGAADVVEKRYGRRPQVLAHPAIVREPVTAPPGRERAGVFLKSVRGNVVKDPEFYRQLGAEVYLHEDAPVLREIADHIHPPMDDAELYRAVSAHRVVVLPYVRGTHSGWLRMCRDLGVSVAVPDCGCYASQAADLADPGVQVYRTGDGADAARVVEELLSGWPADPGREVVDDEIHDAHRVVYRKVVQSR